MSQIIIELHPWSDPEANNVILFIFIRAKQHTLARWLRTVAICKPSLDLTQIDPFRQPNINELLRVNPHKGYYRSIEYLVSKYIPTFSAH